MERILTSEQMRLADKFNIENLGISKDILVDRAGMAVADEIDRRFLGGRVLVCIGKGNNGEDGRIVADVLSRKHGFSVATLTVSNGIFKIFDKKFDIIVDCIFGTGLNREVEGKYKTAIEKINASGAYVVSCDIPSGLNSDNGKPMGIAVKANLTVAIQEFKLGHFLGDGIDYCGEVVAKDIGISIWGEDFVKRLNSDSVARFFEARKRNVHKGDFGKCAIIGGSKQYSGGVLLSKNALCAFKSGMGYVNLVVPESLHCGYIGQVPECLLTPLKDVDGQMIVDEKVLSSLLAYDSIAVGMGMGVSEGVYEIVKYFLDNYEGKLLIDADGLNSLASFGVDLLKNKKCKVVITPHIGEFSRLAGEDKDNIVANPIESARKFAEEFDVTVVLKNAVSIITDGENTFINTTGCAGLAKAGSGDVLSGFISGMISKSDDLVESAAAACYLFGSAGEIATLEQTEFTVTASDVINAIPKAIKAL